MKMKQEAYRNTKEIQKLWKWNKKLTEIPKKYKSYENETRSLQKYKRNTKAMKMKQEAYRNTKKIQKLW